MEVAGSDPSQDLGKPVCGLVNCPGDEFAVDSEMSGSKECATSDQEVLSGTACQHERGSYTGIVALLLGEWTDARPAQAVR